MMMTLIAVAQPDWSAEDVEELDALGIDKAASYHKIRLSRSSARFFSSRRLAWGALQLQTHPQREGCTSSARLLLLRSRLVVVCR